MPCTVFVNGATLQKRTFWRDKVRFIINHALVDAWEEFTGGTFRCNDLGFYKYTKDPRNSSAEVDAALDAFLESKGITMDGNAHCVDSARHLVRHPLVTFGNHSEDHYVLSSLDREQQVEQIRKTRDLLESIDGLPVSSVFSIPFGRPRDFNADTLALLREFDYSGVAMSRAQLNLDRQMSEGLTVIDRFMPDARPMRRIVQELRTGR